MWKFQTQAGDLHLEYLNKHYPGLNARGHHWYKVNIGSGNDSVPQKSSWYHSFWINTKQVLRHLQSALQQRQMISETSYSPASWLFVQQFAQADIKGNIKTPHHWPFLKGRYWWLVDYPHKGPVKQKSRKIPNNWFSYQTEGKNWTKDLN